MFGDSGTATAFEFEEGNRELKFHIDTDETGSDAIIIQDGGYRNPTSGKSSEIKSYEEGISRNSLKWDGCFCICYISKVPQSLNKLMEYCNIKEEEIDDSIFHQANMYMNEKIRKKLKLPENKVPYSLKDFGNTSSATIPLTMITKLKQESLKIIASGFGVGLSWGSVFFETNKIICSELIEM